MFIYVCFLYSNTVVRYILLLQMTQKGKTAYVACLYILRTPKLPFRADHTMKKMLIRTLIKSRLSRAVTVNVNLIKQTVDRSWLH